jgi:hypothetical protein
MINKADMNPETVSANLRTAARLDVMSRAQADEGHSQSHESDAAGSSHHYQTASLEELQQSFAEISPQSDRRSRRRRTPTMTNSISWSIKTDTTQSDAHSQSPSLPDPDTVEQVITAFSAAARAAVGSTAAGSTTAGPQAATRSVGTAVRANLSVSARGTLTALGDAAHNNVHSESGGSGGGGSATARVAAQSRLADAMHDNVHSESGHGAVADNAGQVSRQLAPEAARSARGALQGAMHDNVHSEDGGGGAQLQRAARSQLSADAMHDNVHSESGGSGGGGKSVRQDLSVQAQRAARSATTDAMHDNVHSESKPQEM